MTNLNKALKTVPPVVMLFILTAGPLVAQQQEANLDWKLNNVSQVGQVLTNLGTLLGQPALLGFPGLIRTEYPRGSGVEHTGEGGIWVGGVTPDGDTLVTSTISWAPPPFWETYPSAEPWDTIWVVGRGEEVDIPYWPGYVGVSDQDFVMRYNDYGPISRRVERHTPLNLEFVQTSYHWAGPPGLNEVIVHSYYIIPMAFDIRDAYFTFWLDGNIGDPSGGDHFLDDYSFFYHDLMLAGSADAPGGPDGFAESVIGNMIFPPDRYHADELIWSFHWGEEPYAPGMIPPTDREKYRDLMTTGLIMQDQQSPTGAHYTFSVGPFHLTRGDTTQIRVAQVLGMGKDNFRANARMVRQLVDQDFQVPAPPPTPPLGVEPGNHTVRLTWEPRPDRNPETYQDPNRADGAQQPFEGYRVYKSTQSADGPWTLLGEYDVPGNEFGSNTGLAHEFLDENLLNNVEYYYSVTAFSKPDTVLNWPSLETSIIANARTVVPGTAPPETVGEVAVVPNPYRGDVAYHEFNPPWERPDPSRRIWMEQDRRIQFINLPPEARIRIYTLAGDLVETLLHQDETRGYADWNLTSSAGQAISSGIYVFSVEDLRSRDVQVGKFVVIK